MILNAEQSMVQEMMRNYAQNQLKPTAAHRDKWMVRAANHEILTQACAHTGRPANSKIRIEVDPPRI